MKSALPVLACYLATLILTIGTCLHPLTGLAQANRMEMRQFTLSDGLPDNGIISLIQDRQGFIWAGTINGLAQYNGYDWTVFQEDPADPSSIKGKYVAALLETEDGDLWLGTDQGLSFFDRSMQRFHNYQVDTVRPPYQTNWLPWLVHSLYEDRQGFVWLVAGEGNLLYRWSPETKTVEAIRNDPADLNSIGFNRTGKPDILWGKAAIAQDEAGSIWIGSGDGGGLARFDHETGSFTRIANQLPSDTVHCLFFDREQILWIGTEKGLAQYEAGENTFRYHEMTKAESPVYDIREDANGFLWVSRPFLLERFDKKGGVFKQYKAFSDFQKVYEPSGRWKLGQPCMKWIGETPDGKIYFFFTNDPGHIYSYLPDADSLIEISLPIENKPFLREQQQEIISGIIDRSGYVWAGGVWTHGLLKENRPAYDFTAFRFDENQPGNGLKHNIWGGFAEDLHGNVWISGGGKESLSLFDAVSGQLSPFPGRHKLSYNLFIDEQGIIWSAGVAGLLRINPAGQSLPPGNLALGKKVLASSIQSGSIFLSKNFVTDGDPQSRWESGQDADQWVMVDLESSYTLHQIILHWFPTFVQDYKLQLSEDGKSWRTVYRKKQEEVNSTVNISVSGKARYIRVVCIKPNSTWGYSLYEIEVYSALPEYRIYNPLPYDAPPAPDISHLGFIFQDSEKRIWIGGQDGISLYHPKEDNFSYFPVRSQKEGAKSITVSINGFGESQNGILWMKPWAQEHGVFSFDPQTESQRHYYHQDEDPTSLSDDRVTLVHADRSGGIWIGTANGLNYYQVGEDNFRRFLMGKNISYFFQDAQGEIWIGTWLNGLYLLDVKNGALKQYTVKEGLASNKIRAIQQDRQGNLWIGTDKGLSRFESSSESFRNFYEKDGLISPPSFYRSFRDSHGNLYFGGDYGFVVFNPETRHIDEAVPRLAITGFRLSSQLVKPAEKNSPLEQTIGETTSIRLDHDQNIITFEFATLYYQDPEKNRYKVMLEGLDGDWVDIGNRRFVHYAGLSPGHYTFRVQGANAIGTWSKPLAIELTIRPPWWRSTVAYMLWGALIAGIIYLLYRIQLSRRLAEAETRQVRELDAVKTRLYTNISHEFRTPLTVILGMAERAGEDPENWFREGLKLIKRNGRQVLHLVNQLLDLRKIEAGTMQLHLEQGELIGYLRYLTESFDSLAMSRDIQLHFLPEVPELDMAYDPQKVQTVLSNLLSNAIKFTPPGGEVYLLVRLENKAGSNEQDQRQVLLQVRDTGPGIAADQLPHIFDRFYQVDDGTTRSAEGTGIGLALTQELVKLMDGTIAAESRLGAGTTFKVCLPVRRLEAAETVTEISPPADLDRDEWPHKDEAANETPMVLKESTNGQTAAVISSNHDLPVILLVEDNADVTAYLRACLEGPYRLLTAQDGEAGIDTAIDTIPDLVVSDVMMPKKDGFEVCRRLKSDFRTSHIPVILLTAKADKNSKFEGLEGGADAYLTKPFDREELLLRIRKLIELRRALHQRYATLEPPAAAADHLLQKEDAFLNDLRQTVKEHLSEEDFGIPELCRSMGVSRAQLHRKLKALTGYSTSHFIRAIRLQEAHQLLHTTDLTVSEIAFEVGISNLSFFSRIFTEHFGKTPTEMRK